MNAFVLYSGDMWLSREFLNLMAVCSDKDTAIKMAVEAASYTDEPLDEVAQSELRMENKTNNRGENFLIVPVELNKLI